MTSLPTSDGRGFGAMHRASIVALVFSVGSLIGSNAVADPDLWGHVRFGRLMRELGHVARVDPYSYLTAGSSWINHEWLAEIIFSLAWDAGGALGLMGLKVAVTLAIVGMLYRHLSERGVDILRAGGVATVVAVSLMAALGTIRPQMFTMLLFAVTLAILDAVERGRPRAAWWLPPVFLIWVNLHGGVLAGVGALLIWSAGHGLRVLFTDRDPRALLRERRKEAGAAVLATCLATLANPYGWKLPTFLIRTATVPRPEIVDWQPVALLSPLGALYACLLALTFTALVRHRVQLGVGRGAVLGVSCLLPLVAVRHISLLGLAFGFFAAPELARWELRSHGRADGNASESGATPRGWRPAHRGLALANLLATAVILGVAVSRLGCIPLARGDESIGYPEAAVALMERAGVQGNLAVKFGWGEYAIWHLAPGIKVGMDGRRETVYPDSIYREYQRFHYGVGDWDALLEERPTAMTLVEAGSAPDNLLELTSAWTPVFGDDRSALYARRGSPQEAALHEARADPAGPPGDRCFP